MLKLTNFSLRMTQYILEFMRNYSTCCCVQMHTVGRLEELMPTLICSNSTEHLAMALINCTKLDYSDGTLAKMNIPA